MEVQPGLVHRALVRAPGRVMAQLACIWRRHLLNLPTVAQPYMTGYSGAGSSRRLMLLMQYRWSVGTSYPSPSKT